MNITVLITKLDTPTGQQRDPNYRNGNRMPASGHDPTKNTTSTKVKATIQRDSTMDLFRIMGIAIFNRGHIRANTHLFHNGTPLLISQVGSMIQMTHDQLFRPIIFKLPGVSCVCTG